jgi:hypothetical protein
MKRLSFNQAHKLAISKFGKDLGMFGRLLTNGGNVISGKYVSYGLNRIITKKELLNN